MKGRWRKFLCTAAILVAIAAIAGSLYQRQHIPAGMRADFEWFETLGFPDVKGLPYVRVATGDWTQRGNDAAPSNRYVTAFLLESNSIAFRVFTSDAQVCNFTNTPSSTPEHERVGFQALDLRDGARAEIKRLQSPMKDYESLELFGLQASDQTETFVLSWECWRNGLNSEARNLYRLAETPPQARDQSLRHGRRRWFQKTWYAIKEQLTEILSRNMAARPALRAIVQRTLVQATISRNTAAFGETSVGRPELLARLQDFLRHYPTSDYATDTVAKVAVLKNMISEDSAHRVCSAEDLAALPVSARVRELIFQLRDQHCEKVLHPGDWDIFTNQEGSSNTPAHQLVRIGYAAVPQLIEALDSQTLTRSRDSFGVLTVGDCAQAILGEISGRSFYLDPRDSIIQLAGGPRSSRRQAAEAWWAEFQTKGERQMLIDVVSGGGYYGLLAVDSLCKRYPESAAEPVIEGAKTTTNDLRASYVEMASRLKDPKVNDFLGRELTNGPLMAGRLAAASALRERGNIAALKSTLKEWEEPAHPSRASHIDDDDREKLAEFLGGCDSVEAVSALESSFAKQSIDVRMKIVESIGDKDFVVDFVADGAPTPSPPTLEAREKCLVRALEDTEVREGEDGDVNGKSYSDPRVCDMAAAYLADRWPERYKFDISAPPGARERQRIACLNVWRTAHNQPPFTSAELNSPKLPRGQATKIVTIEWDKHGAKAQPSFTDRIEKLKDKKLQASDIVRLLADFVRNPEPGSSGLMLTATRNEEMTGARISIRLIPAKAAAATDYWDVEQHCTVGTETVLSSGGSGSSDDYQKPDGWDDLYDAIDKGTSAPPETPFRIRVRIERE